MELTESSLIKSVSLKIPENQNNLNDEGEKYRNNDITMLTAQLIKIFEETNRLYKILHDQEFISKNSDAQTNFIYETSNHGVLKNNAGSELLVSAVKQRNLELLEKLISAGIDIDDEDDSGFTAIEHAWIILSNTSDPAVKSSISDIILMLLRNNSKFPRFKKKVDFCFKNASEELKDFMRLSEKVRKYIKRKEFDLLEAALVANPTLIYFYDSENVSVLQFAMTLHCKEAYKLLTSRNIITGYHEDGGVTIVYLQKNVNVLLNTENSNVMSLLLKQFKCSNLFNNKSTKLLDALLRRLSKLCRFLIPLKIFEIITANKDLNFIINTSTDKVKSKNNEIHIYYEFENTKELECIVSNLIKKLCDFVVDICCLDHCIIDPQNFEIRKVLKCYCEVEKFPKCSNDLVNPEIYKNLCDSLRIVEKLQKEEVALICLTKCMREHIFKVIKPSTNLSSQEIYKILLQSSIENFKKF